MKKIVGQSLELYETKLNQKHFQVVQLAYKAQPWSGRVFENLPWLFQFLLSPMQIDGYCYWFILIDADWCWLILIDTQIRLTRFSIVEGVSLVIFMQLLIVMILTIMPQGASLWRKHDLRFPESTKKFSNLAVKLWIKIREIFYVFHLDCLPARLILVIVRREIGSCHPKMVATFLQIQMSYVQIKI